MLDYDAAMEVVLRAIRNLNDELEDDKKVPVSAETRLFGADAVIDSLSLVSIIVDVEAALSDALGYSISLTDDRAVGQVVSPFTDARALTAYIMGLVAETPAR